MVVVVVVVLVVAVVLVVLLVLPLLVIVVNSVEVSKYNTNAFFNCEPLLELAGSPIPRRTSCHFRCETT
jgi:hypothetical protein